MLFASAHARRRPRAVCPQPSGTCHARLAIFSVHPQEAPSEAELPSHKLMLRRPDQASGQRPVQLDAAGLPGAEKVRRIVREEMDRAGAIELLMPAVQPAELWQESGRWEFTAKGCCA